MKILLKIIDLNKAINKIPNLGFVPTMGSLHKGHISLIKVSKAKCNKTLVSIFVNPKQFDNKNDFTKYPRNIKKDLKILKKLKVDFVFIPKVEEIFNNEKQNKYFLNKNEKILCAKYRKGHFEGVLNIIDKFIRLIKPKYMFMGEKDYQQFYLVKKFVERRYKSKVYACPIIREKSSIALSSRNLHLNKKQLITASLIAKNLMIFKKKLSSNFNLIEILIEKKRKELEIKFDISIEYLELRNNKDLKAYEKTKKFRLFLSYYLGNVRLIDNF